MTDVIPTAHAAPVLRCDRLVLRPVRVDDAEAFWPHVSDPETSRWMSWQPHRHLDETVALLERLVADTAAGRGMHWAIEVDGAACGLFSLIAILRTHRSLVYDRAELAYWLGRAHQGRGLMTEAGRAVIDYAFGAMGIHRLVVGHFAVNDASRRLIERLGFRLIGEERDAFRKDGIWHAMKSYDLLVTDLR